MERPITTLFMLMSADGKISTGKTDALDFDRDLPLIKGVREGLGQYYEIEQTTDLWALNSGRVMAKTGVNEGEMPGKTPVSFAILDNSHLTAHGVRHFCARAKQFVLITSDPAHPAFGVEAENMHIILQEKPDIRAALVRLKGEYGCERLTVQTGGTLNGLLLREKLIDYLDLIVAPLLVGGSETATLIDGDSLMSRQELPKLGVLELVAAEPLAHSYLRLRYKVIS